MESGFSPGTAGEKAPGVLWQEIGEWEMARPLGGMSQRGCYIPGWQFWGAHNKGESLIQREANDHVEEATNPSTSALVSLSARASQS